MIDRLSRRDDFQALRREGCVVRRGALQVVYRAHTESPTGVRVAFAIGRSAGTAVVRNRTRRRLRAVMNELAVERNGLPVGDYLIRVDPTGSNANSKDLRVDLEAALNLLCAKQEEGA
ncbi:MAG: ribonuclease P protein component [Actinomycetota bacterium]|nr:ribonuclease P protein component [Actinomycetota bacterium]